MEQFDPANKRKTLKSTCLAVCSANVPQCTGTDRFVRHSGVLLKMGDFAVSRARDRGPNATRNADITMWNVPEIKFVLLVE